MCKDLGTELGSAKAPALLLVQHLDRMGASECRLPVVTTDSSGVRDRWEVTVKHLGNDCGSGRAMTPKAQEG